MNIYNSMNYILKNIFIYEYLYKYTYLKLNIQ